MLQRRARSRRGARAAAVLAAAVLAGSPAASPRTGSGPLAPAAAAPAPAAAAPAPARAAPTGPREEAAVALVVGDSQAHGALATPAEDTWVVAGVRARGYDVELRGGYGTGYVTAAAGRPGYLAALRSGAWALPDPERVRLVVVEGGGNDVAARPAALAAAAQEVVGRLHAAYPRAQLVVVGPMDQTPDPRRTAVSEVLRGAATSTGAGFVDATPWFPALLPATSVGADGVHLSPEGHRAAEPLLARALAGLGAAGGPAGPARRAL
ncbi:SGNH/GDSL hydrolase family protein [Quadrisphaera sp. KR29]|uniref:SGNH/GDSL hydrolase family protein n=1 Tax=Quadrisphaera sp. KR29 TaxID=3461391 RepID=UPI0040448753